MSDTWDGRAGFPLLKKLICAFSILSEEVGGWKPQTTVSYSSTGVVNVKNTFKNIDN